MKQTDDYIYWLSFLLFNIQSLSYMNRSFFLYILFQWSACLFYSKLTLYVYIYIDSLQAKSARVIVERQEEGERGWYHRWGGTNQAYPVFSTILFLLLMMRKRKRRRRKNFVGNISLYSIIFSSRTIIYIYIYTIQLLYNIIRSQYRSKWHQNWIFYF